MNGTVGAIVLAAGASRRLGQPKQLLMLGGETLLERAVRLAGEAGAAPVLTVLGANYEAICASIDLFGKSISVFNDQWDEGMATSIHAGLNALDAAAPDAGGVLILTCDQPRLTADHLRVLLETYSMREEPVIVASTYAGTVGIPAILPRVMFPELLALEGDKGARGLMKEPSCPLISVPFGGGDVDIDMPEDLARLQ